MPQVFPFSVGVEAAKRSFFTSTSVINALDKAERKRMSDIGKFIRADANQSMRRARGRTRPSRPGHPPFAREGQLKRFNYYVYDAREHDVVVGPILLRGQRKPVPGVHEKGLILRTSRGAKKYPQRPYMVPALEKNRRKHVELFKNSIQGNYRVESP